MTRGRLPSALPLVGLPDVGRLSDEEVGRLSAALASAAAAARVDETLPLTFGRDAEDEEEEEEEEGRGDMDAACVPLSVLCSC